MCPTRFEIRKVQRKTGCSKEDAVDALWRSRGNPPKALQIIRETGKVGSKSVNKSKDFEEETSY